MTTKAKRAPRRPGRWLAEERRHGIQAELARKHGVSIGVINSISRGRTYKHIVCASRGTSEEK